MKELLAYFQENWDRKPYPVIDHAIRAQRLEDGTFHFYIHPAHAHGVTTDFIVSETDVKLRF